jgi:type VI secretion system protein ImpG
MDPRLLRLYEEELAHLREVGAEFAREFPRVARRLSMDGLEVADPYVERLLEGCAFLNARTQLKLDAQYPAFIAHLLETLYPNFLAPVPSMIVARLQPDMTNPALARGLKMPRGRSIFSTVARGQNTQCEFRSAHDIWLWPLKITKAQVFAHAPDLPLAQLPVARQIRGALRLRLCVEGGARFDQLPIESLQIHISAPGDAGWRLHELIGSAALGTLVWPVEAVARADVAAQWRDAGTSIASAGYDEDQALLPATLRAFSAYRLVQELAALPQRFLFYDLQQLGPRLARIPGTEVDLVIPFSRADASLEALIDDASVSLYCTPAINLFPKSLDRIQVSDGMHEFHAVPDRARPMDFEVHSIESITGHGTAQAGAQKFLPLYAAYHAEPSAQSAYFTVRRAPRLQSQRQAQQGARSAYIGSEVFLSLVDPRGAPYADELRQLAASALASNRDLATLLPGTPNGEINEGNTNWIIDGVPAVELVECLRGPTRPLQRSAQGEHGWSLINHLTSNQLALADEDPALAAAALRTVMRLYGPEADAGWRSQIEGIVSLRTSQVTRRLPQRGPLVYGLGTQVEIEVDEFAYQGASAFVTASVLERFFAQQASINSFTETKLRSPTRGVVAAWPARLGTGSRLSP